MIKDINPYAPGAGRIPALLVGRDTQIKKWNTDMNRVEHNHDARPLAMFGLRGVGKTVLLQELYKSSKNAGWICAKIEAEGGNDLRSGLSAAFENELANILKPSFAKSISSIAKNALSTLLHFKTSVSSTGDFTFGIDLTGVDYANVETGNFEGDLRRMVTSLSEACGDSKGSLGKGLAILIDEAQELSKDDLAAITIVAHHATQEKLRLVVALAGLPTLPADLAEAKSYAERLYDFNEITALTMEQASLALTAPAQKEGAEWDDDATKLVLEHTFGYPYFIQEYGAAVWEVGENLNITVADAKLGIAAAKEQLDKGFFKSRWDRATEAQKKYLRAMSEDADNKSNSKAIAERLGMSITSLGQRRAELISKGLIYAPEHGFVAYTVPRMADFISRQQ